MSHPTYRKRTIPTFIFEHAGSHKALAWPKYKLKECWTLVLCILALRGQSGAVIVHNWRGEAARKFTREFRDRRAAKADPHFGDAPIIESHAPGALVLLLTLVPAVILMLLPVRSIVRAAEALVPKKIGPLVVYCDGHLSGFALVLAARARGKLTMTLHHGLYRSDDRGSLMGIRNFVSDRICLWDQLTMQAFLDAGFDKARLLHTGEYGFGGLDRAEPSKPDRIILCPPYNLNQFSVFKKFERLLPDKTEILWSLHPILRADHGNLPQAVMVTVTPKPAFAICGDSGVLMEALARNIPVITIADRPLTSAHLPFFDVENVDAAALSKLMDRARKGLASDRARFGFDII